MWCSLISAVGIFCLGAGVSIVHGIHSIIEPSDAANLGWGVTVLCLSTFVEGYTLAVAARAVIAGARTAGMRFVDYIKSGRDPVSVAIMAEDGAAVAGVIVAASCTKLAEVTSCTVRIQRPRTASVRVCRVEVALTAAHTSSSADAQRSRPRNPWGQRGAPSSHQLLDRMQVWDGVGSVLVGLLLGGVAVYLIQRNRSFLIGRSMVTEDFQRIVRHLKRDPVIKNIYEAKSEEIGEGIFRCVLQICPRSDTSTLHPARVENMLHVTSYTGEQHAC